MSKRRRAADTSDVDKLKRRHAGVIGLSACVLAFPYQVPDFMPNILMILSRHLDDPQPIQVCTVVVVVLVVVVVIMSLLPSTSLSNQRSYCDDKRPSVTPCVCPPN